MLNLFEVKVKYEKIDEQSGKEKKVTEKYLIDALSFTEAEAKIYKEMESMIRGEFIIMSIARANYTEVFETPGDVWYKAKVSFASIDEKSGKEKKVSNNILCMGDSVDNAYSNINESMGGMTVDFTIDGIADSKIMDFFKYEIESTITED